VRDSILPIFFWQARTRIRKTREKLWLTEEVSSHSPSVWRTNEILVSGVESPRRSGKTNFISGRIYEAQHVVCDCTPTASMRSGERQADFITLEQKRRPENRRCSLQRWLVLSYCLRFLFPGCPTARCRLATHLIVNPPRSSSLASPLPLPSVSKTCRNGRVDVVYQVRSARSANKRETTPQLSRRSVFTICIPLPFQLHEEDTTSSKKIDLVCVSIDHGKLFPVDINQNSCKTSRCATLF